MRNMPRLIALNENEAMYFSVQNRDYCLISFLLSPDSLGTIAQSFLWIVRRIT